MELKVGMRLSTTWVFERFVVVILVSPFVLTGTIAAPPAKRPWQ
jgi:hypothetical protein